MHETIGKMKKCLHQYFFQSLSVPAKITLIVPNRTNSDRTAYKLAAITCMYLAIKLYNQKSLTMKSLSSDIAFAAILNALDGLDLSLISQGLRQMFGRLSLSLLESSTRPTDIHDIPTRDGWATNGSTSFIT